MSQAPKTGTRPGPQKTPSHKSTLNAGQQGSRTSKENTVNSTAAATPMSSRRQPFGEVTTEANNIQDMEQKMLEMQAALEKAEAAKEALEQQLSKTASNTEPSDTEDADQVGEADETSKQTAKKKRSVIPRPTGNVNIQEAMGLAGSAKRRMKYNSILRVVKELAGNARLNWELEWSEIPVRDKAQFFQVVRETIPDMGRYANDWATEMIVRQYMKNKRSYAVQKGFLEVKPKWDYLKTNAAKRSNAPRGNGKRKATSQGSSGPAAKKARLAKASVKSKKISAKSKGKARAIAVSDEEGNDDDEEMGGSGKGDESEEEESDD